MANYYKLKIYQRGQNEEPESPTEKSTFYIEGSVTSDATTLLNVIPTNTEIQLILNSLEYTKELYRPSSADVVIQASSNKVGSGDIVKAVMDCFRDKSAEISVSDKDGITADSDYFLGKDFLVYSVQPHYEADSSSGIKIDVKLYSRDILLTEDKFSHCYLNKKLGRDIIEGSLKAEGMLADLDIKYNVGESRLQVLKIGEKTEIIQPYRVQYNEDFYSFISRLAGRCGEFLYFEDGQLCFGIPSGSVSTLKDSTNIKSIRYPQMVKSTLKVRSFYRDYQKDDKAVKSNELVFNEDSSYDEYFDVFDKSELPDSFMDELLFGPFIKLILSGLVPALFSDLTNHRKYLTTLGLTKWASESAMEVGKVAAKSAYINDVFEENVFSNSEKNTDSFKSTEQSAENKLSQFSSVTGYEKLFASYYSEVKSAEKDVKDSIICLEVVANSTDCRLALGDRVKLNSDSTEYIVCKVSGTAGWERNSCDDEDAPAIVFNDRQYVEIVPKKSIPITADSTTKVSIYLPPYEEGPASVASAQMAVVEDAADPRYLGRVRIKYPWQSESEKASPWVRFISPMASKNGANAHFRLTKGDEVMVDYIGGNIERPYVIGALYNKDVKPNKYLYTPYDRAIISETGERLEIQRGNYDQLLTDLVPLYGYVMPFIPAATHGMKDGLDNASTIGEYLKTAHGKVILSDTFGFWTFEGDTAARSVTIDSMLGKVTISAMTGINISAPLGDITIEGKNINIKASNNITIESGLEIRNEREKNATRGAVSGAGTIVAEVATDCLADLLASKLDYSILRSIAEAIVAPMEGTLKIKSNRYLNLEAGSGSAYDLDAGTSRGFISKELRAKTKAADSLNTGSAGSVVVLNLYDIKVSVESAFNGLAVKHHSAFVALSSLKQYIAGNKDYKFPLSADDTQKKAKTEELFQVIDSSTVQNAVKKWPTADIDVFNTYMGFLIDAFQKAKHFWTSLEEVRSADKVLVYGTSNINISDKLYSELKEIFDNKFEDFTDEQKCAEKKKYARRALYAYYLSKIKLEGVVSALSEAAAADDKQWEQAVRTMYVKEMPSVGAQIANKFASHGWSFVDYDKYQSESYIKYPTARGKILFSQELGRCFEINNNGTIHVENISNHLLALQRALLEDNNWIA